MHKPTNSHTGKLTFYPMAGRVLEQFDNLLQTLKWLDKAKPTPAETYERLKDAFELSHYFARDIYTVIFISSGLVTVRNNRCYLTQEGQIVLDTASPITLLEIFEKQFVGISAILEVLRDNNNTNLELLIEKWFDILQERFPQIKKWSPKTIHTQCRHRINWLRAMGFITVVGRKYFLSEDGWQLVLTHPPEVIAIQQREVRKQEKVLQNLTLGKFQPFASKTEKVRSVRETFVRDRAFRGIVVRQYEYHCAVCGFCLVTPRGIYEAEAAHIVPKRLVGSDDPRNGMCLCGTHHWAFDEGVISVSADNFTVVAASYLKSKSDKSVQSILGLLGRRIRGVVDHEYAPSPEALAWHNQNIFLG